MDYPTGKHSGSLVHFESNALDILLVEANDFEKTLETLHVIHTAIPHTWKLIVSEDSDPSHIIDAVRAGAREFLPMPLTSDSLMKAFNRFIKEQGQGKEIRKRGELYWVTSAKGGSGTTSLAINLAASISGLRGTRVSLLDLNQPVGDAATYLNLKPQFTVANAISAGDRLDSVLLESYLEPSHGISVLSGAKHYSSKQSYDKEGLERLLNVAAYGYTHTLVDQPAVMPNDQLLSLAELSDKILVVLTPELPALWRTHRLLHFLEQVDCQHKLRLILNRFEKKGEITKAEMEKTLEQPISWTLPNDYRSAIQAINSGRPLISVNHTPLASGIVQLAHDITGIQPKQKKDGLFSGMFSQNR
jgi:pilus assembly protein CpaE